MNNKGPICEEKTEYCSDETHFYCFDHSKVTCSECMNTTHSSSSCVTATMTIMHKMVGNDLKKKFEVIK